MRNLGTVLVFALLFAQGCSVLADETPPAVLLERGIYQEQTLGDIDAAMATYQEILRSVRSGHRHQAEATFRLAACLSERGSYAQATRHYLNVVKDFGQFKQLAERSGKQVVEISKALALEGGFMEADDITYFGDLMYVLSASLSYDGKELPSKVIAEAQRMAKLLSEQVAVSDDEILFSDCIEALGELEELVQKGDRDAAADLFDDSDAFDFFMYREPLVENIDVFEPALGWKDKIAAALTEEKAPRAKRFANKIIEYLLPLEALPEDDEEKRFVLALLEEARAIDAIVEEDPAAAVALLFEHDKKRWETTGVMSLVLGGAELLPGSEFPHFSLFYAFSIQATKAIERGDDGVAREAITRALASIEEIASSKAVDDVGDEMIEELRKGLKEASVALEVGDREAAIEAIGVESQNVESGIE